MRKSKIRRDLSRQDIIEKIQSDECVAFMVVSFHKYEPPILSCVSMIEDELVINGQFEQLLDGELAALRIRMEPEQRPRRRK